MKKLALLFALGSLIACKAEKPTAAEGCKCRVKIEAAWCGPVEEQKAKIEAIERDPLTCSGATGTVVDLDATYVVEGCSR
jgi:hypothetical protein